MDRYFADDERPSALGEDGAAGSAGLRVPHQPPPWLRPSRALARRPHVESHFADGTLWLRPYARFTFIECAAVDAAFVAAGPAVRRVVVTLDAVDCIDSSAAGMLLYMLEALGERSVELRAARAPVDAMLRRLCLDRVFTIAH